MAQKNEPKENSAAPSATHNASASAQSVDERLAAFNAKLQTLQDEFDLVLAAEPYIERGLMKARPVVFPREMMKHE